MQAPLNPGPELGAGTESGRSNVNETAHWPSGEIHGACVGLRKCFLVFVGGHAYDKVLAYYPAAHVSVDHHGKPTKHALVLDCYFRVGHFFSQDVAKPVGCLFVEWHQSIFKQTGFRQRYARRSQVVAHPATAGKPTIGRGGDTSDST